jgi:hypothetical protein
MSDRAGSRVNAETLNQGPLHVSADYQMRPGDFMVIAESAAAEVVVTLPAKSEAIPGMVYTIYAPAGATKTVSVNDKETGSAITTYGTLDAAGDTLAVVCTGETWVVVGSVLT